MSTGLYTITRISVYHKIFMGLYVYLSLDFIYEEKHL